jgi:hypothetical protein
LSEEYGAILGVINHAEIDRAAQDSTDGNTIKPVVAQAPLNTEHAWMARRPRQPCRRILAAECTV